MLSGKPFMVNVTLSLPSVYFLYTIVSFEPSEIFDAVVVTSNSFTVESLGNVRYTMLPIIGVMVSS